MRHILALAATALLLTQSTPVAAQVTGTKYIGSSGELLEAQGSFPLDVPGAPSVSRREIWALATNNTASAPITVYGGSYILNQVCGTYGTVTFQALGPDGVTYQTVTSFTAASATGGVEMRLGSYQQVRITLSGTAGCNIKLARVPA